jgi:ABC-type multidrug transport system fused ATPase/permease subunit
MFALVPIQNRVFGIIAVRRKQQLQLSDKRVKMQNEAMSGIKIIKLNGWETSMLAAISAVRDEELAVARNLAFINAFVSCLITTLPTLVAVSAFALYSGVAGGEMVAWVVFPALSLFNQLRFPIMFLPRVLSSTLRACLVLEHLVACLLTRLLSLLAQCASLLFRNDAARALSTCSVHVLCVLTILHCRANPTQVCRRPRLTEAHSAVRRARGDRVCGPARGCKRARHACRCCAQRRRAGQHPRRVIPFQHARAKRGALFEKH